jgi:hypothetical protein
MNRKMTDDSLSFPSFGERGRLGCRSVRLAPNVRGVAVTKRWVVPGTRVNREGAAHCARGGRAPHFNCILPGIPLRSLCFLL